MNNNRSMNRRSFVIGAATAGAAAVAASTFGLTGCTQQSKTSPAEDTQGNAHPANKLRVFDLHCDTLDRLAFHSDSTVFLDYAEEDAAIPAHRMETLADNDAQISLERTKAYSWCQCFAAFIPDESRGDLAWTMFERVSALFKRDLERCSNQLVRVANNSEIEAAFAANKTAGMLTVEGASFLEDDGTADARLAAMTEAGVRMVTLTWNGVNALGSGNTTNNGLTPFGRTMVRELENRNMIVDVSHLNGEGFKDVCSAATRPFVATHSNARAICDHPRNLADWQLREITDRGGIIGLNYYRNFISSTNADPAPDELLRHVEHLLKITGDHVLALGSDYDGAEVASWLDPCDRVGNLHALIASQFGSTIANRIFFENAADFFTRQTPTSP